MRDEQRVDVGAVIYFLLTVIAMAAMMISHDVNAIKNAVVP